MAFFRKDRERFIGGYDPEHEMPDPDRDPRDRYQSEAYQNGARDSRFAYRWNPDRVEAQFGDRYRGGEEQIHDRDHYMNRDSGPQFGPRDEGWGGYDRANQYGASGGRVQGGQGYGSRDFSNRGFAETNHNSGIRDFGNTNREGGNRDFGRMNRNFGGRDFGEMNRNTGDRDFNMNRNAGNRDFGNPNRNFGSRDAADRNDNRNQYGDNYGNRVNFGHSDPYGDRNQPDRELGNRESGNRFNGAQPQEGWQQQWHGEPPAWNRARGGNQFGGPDRGFDRNSGYDPDNGRDGRDHFEGTGGGRYRSSSPQQPGDFNRDPNRSFNRNVDPRLDYERDEDDRY
jgi:hypothetical protein